jgi:MerR family transcriptional regulator, light-induced transcriptional regulator
MKRFYSSRELAEVFSVNESTIKRWADTGYIECVKTKGGHRRFPIQSVMRFVQESKMEVPELASQLFASQELRSNLVAGNTDVLVPKLKAALLAGDLTESLTLLRAGLASKPNLLGLFSDVVFPVLTDIGNAWAAGKLTIDAEHLASQTIRDALTRLQSSIHTDPSQGNVALLSCFEGQLHDIVLSCVSIYLRSKGWQVFNLGQSTPTDSLLRAVKTRKPHLVLISALTIDQERKFVLAVNHKIAPSVHRSGAKLAIGGPGLKSRFSGRLHADFVSESVYDLEDISLPVHYQYPSSKSPKPPAKKS